MAKYDITGNEAYKDDVLDAFRLLDIQGKGFLSETEVKSALSWLGVVVKEWPLKQIYTELDFLQLSVQRFPDLVRKRSIILLAAAYRRQYFLKVAESQLSQPIPTWPKHLPVRENENKKRSPDHAEFVADFLHTQSIDTGLICPPRIHRPHWLAFKKWKLFYQTFYQPKALRHCPSKGSASLPADLMPELNSSQAAVSRRIEFVRRNWVSNRSMSQVRLPIEAPSTTSEIESLLQRQRQKRSDSLQRTVQICKVRSDCEVVILSPDGRRTACAKKPSLSQSKRALLSKGPCFPMLSLGRGGP